MNLMDILGINMKAAPKPIEEGKAYVKVVREKAAPMNMGMASFINPADNKALSVVVDPYTGRYYGEGTQQQYINSTTAQVQQSQRDLAYLNKTGRMPKAVGQSAVNFGMGGFAGMMMPLSKADKEAQLKTLNDSIANGTKELANFQNNFTQQKDMIKSFNKYGDNWNKYFEGSYKNPRVTEANASQIGGDSQQLMETPAKNKLKIPKTVGTGITSTGNLNPFGSLDAGLNI